MAADRNVISANGGHGVQIQRTTPSSPTPATGNVVEGNYVGTNATGDAAVANALDGISLVWGAQGNTIGGSVPGAGNVVSGNGRIGISVFDISAGNLIEGNYVGTNAAGTAAVGGNHECGIVLISAQHGGRDLGRGAERDLGKQRRVRARDRRIEHGRGQLHRHERRGHGGARQRHGAVGRPGWARHRVFEQPGRWDCRRGRECDLGKHRAGSVAA